MKKRRHEMIVKLVKGNNIETQEELAERLKEAGFTVTQATVSRDIRELKLTKIASGNGKQKYIVMNRDDIFLGEKYARILKEGLLSMEQAQNILVVKTAPGMAMAVAAAMDDMKLHEIVGCIAGDDTIMAAIRTTEETEIVMDKLRLVLGE